MWFCEDCGLWHDPFNDCVLRSSTVERIRPSMARAAAVLALAYALPFDRPDPGELPSNGAWKNGDRCRGREYTASDHRARQKRVAKRRAKKGYR